MYAYIYIYIHRCICIYIDRQTYIPLYPQLLSCPLSSSKYTSQPRKLYKHTVNISMFTMFRCAASRNEIIISEYVAVIR